MLVMLTNDFQPQARIIPTLPKTVALPFLQKPFYASTKLPLIVHAPAYTYFFSFCPQQKQDI